MLSSKYRPKITSSESPIRMYVSIIFHMLTTSFQLPYSFSYRTYPKTSACMFSPKRELLCPEMAAQSFSKPPNSTQAPQPDCRKTHPFSSTRSQSTKPQSLKSPWLGTSMLSLRSSILRPVLPKYSPIAATVVFSLPTAKPARVSSTEKVPKWSSKAIKSFAMGELEARKLKYGTTGTEALIMGILIEGTNQASKVLRANRITLLKVREETVKLLGKADMYYFSPEHPPLTEAAQRALDWAIDEKLKSGEDGEITTLHLLLGVWSEEESPGHKILAALGFNSEKAQELHSLISKPGFVEN